MKTFQPSRRKEEQARFPQRMAQLTDEKFWLLEELKEEVSVSSDRSKNDCVYILF